MSPSATPAFRNQLLASLRADDLALLQPALQLVDLPLTTVLEEAGVPIEHVYFLESGFASVVTGIKVQIEIGLIGREGMSGLSIVMDDDRSVNQTFMQAGGTALRLTAAELRTALGDSPSLRSSLLRYAQAFIVQTSQTALVNGRAKLEARLARWLLMAHDRFEQGDFPFTHRFIAMMLGVRRAGVTDALHILEGRGLIKARRGQITVIDRKGLHATADPSYGVPEAEYARLVLDRKG
jgi:CRP-like cAMP-binding protein